MPVGNGANVTGSAPRWLRGARGSSQWDHLLGHFSDSSPTPTGHGGTGTAPLPAPCPFPAPQTSVGGWGSCAGTSVGRMGRGLARSRRDPCPVSFGLRPPLPTRGARRPRGRAVGSCEYRLPGPQRHGVGGNVLPTQLNARQDGLVGKGQDWDWEWDALSLAPSRHRPTAGGPQGPPPSGSSTSSTEHVGRPLSGEQAQSRAGSLAPSAQAWPPLCAHPTHSTSSGRMAAPLPSSPAAGQAGISRGFLCSRPGGSRAIRRV